MTFTGPVSRHRYLLLQSLSALLFGWPLGSGTLYAETVTVGVEVEFVDNIAVRTGAVAADNSQAVESAAVVTRSTAGLIEIAATPGRELSILATTPAGEAGHDPVGVTCAYGQLRNEYCAQRSLSTLTERSGTLVVTASDSTPGSSQTGRTIEVTIAHH